MFSIALLLLKTIIWDSLTALHLCIPHPPILPCLRFFSHFAVTGGVLLVSFLSAAWGRESPSVKK